MAFTGRLSLDYVAPSPLGEPLEFRARLDRREGRKLHIVCTGAGPRGAFVEASSVFIAVKPEDFQSFFDETGPPGDPSST